MALTRVPASRLRLTCTRCLTNAHIDGPYVLVGHSIGAIHVQAYTNQYPEEVVGLVLVDRAPAEYLSTLSDEEILATEGGSSSSTMAIMRLASTIGFVRLTNFQAPIYNDLPADVQLLTSAAAFQARFFTSLGEEWDTYAANLRYGAALHPSAPICPSQY